MSSANQIAGKIYRQGLSWSGFLCGRSLTLLVQHILYNCVTLGWYFFNTLILWQHFPSCFARIWSLHLSANQRLELCFAWNQSFELCSACGLSGGIWMLHSVFGTPIAKSAQGLAYRVQHFCNYWPLPIIIFGLFRTSLCAYTNTYLNKGIEKT